MLKKQNGIDELERSAESYRNMAKVQFNHAQEKNAENRSKADDYNPFNNPSQADYDEALRYQEVGGKLLRRAKEYEKQAKEKMKALSEYTAKLNEKKRKEAEAQAALDAARAEYRKLLKDLEKARQCLLEKIRNAPGTSRIKKPLSAIARRDNPEVQAFLPDGNTYNKDPNSYGKIFDLRNFSNGQNFRKTAKGKESEMGPSQSYYLRDYVFSDSMVASEDDKNYEKIQPLILSEFQPYEMITIADVIGGVGDLVANLVNGTVGMFVAPILKTAGKCIQNNLINTYSQNTKDLYKTDGRVRSYFAKDPVQTVQNMFNGGKWLNTYELPYYGR